MPSLTLPQVLSSFLSQDPGVRTMQILLVSTAVIVVFLVFYVLRDIVLRSSSFFVQLLCILLVAFLPLVGFLLYLLVRPARTVKEREMEQLLLEIHAKLHAKNPQQQEQHKPSKSPKKHDKR